MVWNCRICDVYRTRSAPAQAVVKMTETQLIAVYLAPLALLVLASLASSFLGQVTR